MNLLHRRVSKLEGPMQTTNFPRIIFRTIYGPSKNGPENLGIAYVNIIKGGRFSRSDYPNDKAFKDAVSEVYLASYTEPLKWDGDEVFWDSKHEPLEKQNDAG